jgi:hypothetical protein
MLGPQGTLLLPGLPDDLEQAVLVLGEGPSEWKIVGGVVCSEDHLPFGFDASQQLFQLNDDFFLREQLELPAGDPFLYR